jgi:hypothetical protein
MTNVHWTRWRWTSLRKAEKHRRENNCRTKFRDSSRTSGERESHDEGEKKKDELSSGMDSSCEQDTASLHPLQTCATDSILNNGSHWKASDDKER